jgi:phage-related protein
MSEIPPLNVRVTIDASGIQAGVSKTTSGLNQITAKASKLQSAFGSLKVTMLGVLGGNLLTTGVMAIGRELNAMKKETIDLQTTTARLNQALNGIGITSQRTQKDVLGVADAYYQLGFEGSETISAMGTLVTATGDVDQATKLMAMSADLARYKNIDMETSAKILARGTQGSAKAFKELGITLDTTIPKNQAITKAFDELNTKIGGQAVSYSKTFAGQVSILKERFDNLFQAIASKVLPVLSAFLGYLTENGTALVIYGGIVLATIAIIKTYGIVTMAVKSIQQAYAFWTYAQAASTNVFKFAMVQLNAVMLANPVGLVIVGIMALGVAFVWAWNKFEGFRKGVVKGIQIIVNAFGYLLGYWATALKVVAKIPGMGWAKDASEALDKAANSVRKYSDGLDSLADKKIKTPKIPGFVKPGDPTGIKGNIPGGDKGGGGGSGRSGGGSTVVQNITVYASNTNDIAKQMAKAAKNGKPIGGK